MYVRMWHGVYDMSISVSVISQGRTQSRGRWKQGNFPIVHLEVTSLGASHSHTYVSLCGMHTCIICSYIYVCVCIHTYISICMYVRMYSLCVIIIILLYILYRKYICTYVRSYAHTEPTIEDDLSLSLTSQRLLVVCVRVLLYVQ